MALPQVSIAHKHRKRQLKLQVNLCFHNAGTVGCNHFRRRHLNRRLVPDGTWPKIADPLATWNSLADI